MSFKNHKKITRSIHIKLFKNKFKTPSVLNRLWKSPYFFTTNRYMNETFLEASTYWIEKLLSQIAGLLESVNATLNNLYTFWKTDWIVNNTSKPFIWTKVWTPWQRFFKQKKTPSLETQDVNKLNAIEISKWILCLGELYNFRGLSLHNFRKLILYKL